MTSFELKSTVILALIFACRMLGLFMILPVLALYEGKIPGGTPALIGLVAGIYGLTQALLQLPCGILSDYFGRRSVIIGGLIVFIIGSLIAAFSNTIWGLIIGRAIQGAGAIGSPILALVSDVTRNEVRTRAMALIGISIGMTFVLAILLGPLLNAYVGLSGIFVMTAVLASSGILLFYFLGPNPTHSTSQIALGRQIRVLTQHHQLWGLNLNIFILHAILTACFLILPLKIQEVTGLTSSQVWRFYLPVLGMSLIFVAPLLRYADIVYWQKKLLKTAMIGLSLAISLLINTTQMIPLMVVVTLFFVAFNFLEASLPALVSRMAPQTSKGSALGVYSFAQFLGMFAGGTLGGFLLQWVGPWGIGISCLLLTVIGWLAMSKSMRSEQWQEASIKSF